jgi:hypothetical protein
MKQIKHMIQMREKAEQEKQATNQAILDEHIVDEIEQDLRACTCHDGDIPPAAPSASCIKSCLKKVPTKEVGDKTRSNGETSRNKGCKSKKQKNKHRQASNDYSSSNCKFSSQLFSMFHGAQMTSRHLRTASNHISFSLYDSCSLNQVQSCVHTSPLFYFLF